MVEVLGKIISHVKSWWKYGTSFDAFMQKIIYLLLCMDFLILVLPYFEFPFLADWVIISQPNKDIMPVYERTLRDLHLYLIGAYVFKKIGKYAVQGIVSIAVMKVGGDINKALDTIKDDEKPMAEHIAEVNNVQGYNQAGNI